MKLKPLTITIVDPEMGPLFGTIEFTVAVA
jgi:hypothetical protein